jgi:N-methylhydantoinase B/oxoprolinase/acetone carboxylase alpha subunit
MYRTTPKELRRVITKFERLRQFTRRWTTAQIQVAVRVDANAAVVDFTGTSGA